METIANNVVHVDFRAPRTGAKDAPFGAVNLVQSEAEALAWSIKAAELKVEDVARMVHKSKGYISKLQNGRQAIPHKLVEPLCRATGSNLLRQYIDLQRALSGDCRAFHAVELMRRAA